MRHWMRWQHTWSIFGRCVRDLLARCSSCCASLWKESQASDLHEGKTKGTGAGLRQGTSKKGEEAWQPEGVKVLGTSIGSPQFTTAKLRERVGDERRFWDAVPTVKNLQCAWQLLLQSANPQANHTLRTTTTTAYGQPWRKSRNRTLRARSPLDDR